VKVGDLVRVKRPTETSPVGIVVSETRQVDWWVRNHSFVDVLMEGQVLSVNCTALEVIGENR
jgi:hypothetical protein